MDLHINREVKLAPVKESVRALPAPEPLAFHLPPSFPTYVESALQRFDGDLARQDHAVLAYLGYGKNMLKNFRVSPDSFVQMSIQLAYYKLFGECKATYESAQTKKYAYGRTETCRSVSEASVAFVKGMTSPDVSREKKEQLARQAIKSHSEYMSASVDGRGVDRHFLGLFSTACLKINNRRITFVGAKGRKYARDFYGSHVCSIEQMVPVFEPNHFG
jgi:carnitine O-acetyltransferase